MSLVAGPRLIRDMDRLIVHVEGQTEETFVKEILAPYLYSRGYTRVSARLVGNARQRDRRGGIRGWDSVRADILNHLREDVGCLATTMVDYYALPQSGNRAWPGRSEAASASPLDKPFVVERALLSDICEQMGGSFNAARFQPYVMMHEFEGLLFSDCRVFANSIGHPELTTTFEQIRAQFSTPEEINDSPATAPSKRIEALVPEYQKPLLGAFAILTIGLDAIRSQCPHFNSWITHLERWQS